MTVEDLIRFTERRLDVPSGSVLSRDRHRSIAMARHVAVWMLTHHRYPEPSLSEVGQMLGLHHSTAFGALAKIAERRTREPRFRELLDGMLAESKRVAWPELECARAS